MPTLSGGRGWGGDIRHFNHSRRILYHLIASEQ